MTFYKLVTNLQLLSFAENPASLTVPLKAPRPASCSLVRPLWPLCKPACKLSVNCAPKKTFLSTNWSKFLCIFYRHHFNFESQNEISVLTAVVWSHEELLFLLLCEIVSQLRWDGSEIATILNEFNQSLERKKKLVCRRLFMSSRKTSQQEIFCLRRAATAKKSDRKACVIMHVQSGRSSNLMFSLLKPLLEFFYFA